MPHGSGRVLVINPGSTSTKFGVYTKDGPEFVRTVHHSDEDLAQFHGHSVLDQLDYRAGQIKSELQKAGYGAGASKFDAIVGRGGLLPPVASGCYLVDDVMLEQLRLARRGEHASNLGAVLRWGGHREATRPIGVWVRRRFVVFGNKRLDRSGTAHRLGRREGRRSL